MKLWLSLKLKFPAADVRISMRTGGETSDFIVAYIVNFDMISPTPNQIWGPTTVKAAERGRDGRPNSVFPSWALPPLSQI